MNDPTEFFATLPVKPAFKKESGQFKIKPVHGNTKYIKMSGISNICLVITQGEDMVFDIVTTHIVFSDYFERCVGRRMPMGVGLHQQAVVIVSKTLQHPLYQIIAAYTDWSHPAVLWRQESRPTWLGRIKA